jgi:outer membrane protein assembly factor BamB
LLAVADEHLCLALRLRTGQSTLVCMNPADRKTIWTRTVPPVSDFCIAGSSLYVRSQDVLALDMESGNLLWNFASTGCSPVTYANGRVWFADSGDQGHLIALDERTGSKMLDLTGIRSCNAFVELGDKGYVKTHDGAVHVILFEG